MAPVGRWQQGRDLTWYAKEDQGDEEKAQREREEIQRIKQAEQEAMAHALGLPVSSQSVYSPNANLIPVGEPEARKANRHSAAGEDRAEYSAGSKAGLGEPRSRRRERSRSPRRRSRRERSEEGDKDRGWERGERSYHRSHRARSRSRSRDRRHRRRSHSRSRSNDDRLRYERGKVDPRHHIHEAHRSYRPERELRSIRRER